jgi:hypothetical protein
MGTDVANTEQAELPDMPQAEAPPVQRYQGGTWDDLMAESGEVFGADLESGQMVVGVPFGWVHATFRPGDYASQAETTFVHKGEKGNYVSLDIIIAPEEEIEKRIKRNRIMIPGTEVPVTSLAELGVIPGEHLAINEGGTGVYRQVMEYLEGYGLIGLPDGPDEGRYGESRFDCPAERWTFGAEIATGAGFPVRLYCPRGLRSSKYENEYTKSAITRYFG